MKELLLGYVVQMLGLVGTIVLVGLVLELTTSRFLANTGRGGQIFFIVTGFLGTPVHELSHAAMCLVFGHRIERICLFSPDDKTGTMGYVEHRYNPTSIYQQIGNFFIGIAPMIGGSLVLLLLLAWLLPDTYAVFGENMALLNDTPMSPFSGETYRMIFGCLGDVLGALVAPDQLLQPAFWGFLVLALMIAMHMDISPADLSAAKPGFAVFAVAIFVLDLVCYFLWETLFFGLVTMSFCLGWLVLMLMLPATLLMLGALLVSYLIRACKK